MITEFFIRIIKDECSKIDDFVVKGGKVFYLKQKATFKGVSPYGFWKWDEEMLDDHTSEFRSSLEIEDVLEICGVVPKVKISNRHVKSGVLQGDDYALVIMTNTDPRHNTVCGAVITTSIPFKKARYISPDLETELDVIGKEIKLPDIIEGGVVVLEQK